jgi:acetolactate synthase I/II/III large subunit
MKVHDALAMALTQHGVDTVFGLMGEANMLIVDDFVNHHGGRYIASPREDGGVLAAMGYSHSTGRLGVATVTHGPALTNTITALVEATRSHVPLLLIAGDTELAERINLQDIDQAEVTRVSGAGFHRVRSAESCVEDLGIAVRRATVERRPIVLNVPIDIQEQETSPTGPATYGAPRAQAPGPDPDALDRAVGIIASSRRPVVLAGWGAIDAEAASAARRLAARLGAPVATTLKAKGLFAGDECDLGTFGTFTSEVAGEYLGDADCVIALGASLNRFTAAHGALLDGKAIVHVDADPAQLGEWTPVDAPIVGDAGRTAEAIVELLDELEHEPSSFRSPAMAAALADDEPTRHFEDTSGGGTVDMRTFTIRMNGLLPADRSVVTDGGHFVVAPLRYLDVPEPRALLYPLAFGSVGLGLGCAVGVAAGQPGRPTVLVCGDGGMMMSLAEFNTAVRHDLDLIVLVMNDGSYGAEYHNYLKYDMDPALSLLAWPDFAPIADALGGTGVTVRDLRDIEEAAAVIERRTGPVLVDVKLDPAVRVGFFD